MPKTTQTQRLGFRIACLISIWVSIRHAIPNESRVSVSVWSSYPFSLESLRLNGYFYPKTTQTRLQLQPMTTAGWSGVYETRNPDHIDKPAVGAEVVTLNSIEREFVNDQRVDRPADRPFDLSIMTFR